MTKNRRNHIKIKKGYNLKIDGAPSKSFGHFEKPESLQIQPSKIRWIKPKLLVKEGEQVNIGTPLFYDKLNPNLKFVSPGGGRISSIQFGYKRVIEKIIIKLAEFEENHKYSFNIPKEYSKLNREQIKSILLESGLWTLIRQRPYSMIPDPRSMPKAIFISTMPTQPFALDQEYIFSIDGKGFQIGLDILSKLSDGKINLINNHNSTLPLFTDAKNVDIYQVSGPHPAGNTGIHIHHIDPINTGETVWYLDPQDVQRIGLLFLTGKLHLEKYISIGGSSLEEQHYLKVRFGSLLKDILKNNTIAGNSRIISGDVLTGEKINADESLGYYDEIISVIPEGGNRELLGWMMPGLNKYSLGNTFLSKLFKKNNYNLDTNKNGSVRTIIPFGSWESVLPMDIIPTFLVKSILAKDVEEMEKLGIYECDEEDFALCSFICTSKVEVSDIIREGLEYMKAEG